MPLPGALKRFGVRSFAAAVKGNEMIGQQDQWVVSYTERYI